MSPLPRQKRSFLFLPTTWSKIVICLTISSAIFVIFFVGKEIITLAENPVIGTSAHPIAAPIAHPATSVQSDPHPVASTPPVVGLHTTSADLIAMNLHTLTTQRNYVYTFEGTATYRHLPCAHAMVVVRVTVGGQTRTAGGITNTDGSYAVSVPIIASANETVDWVVEARTAEMKKAESIGRRIATEDTTEEVTLQTSLALLSQ